MTLAFSYPILRAHCGWDPFDLHGITGSRHWFVHPFEQHFIPDVQPVSCAHWLVAPCAHDCTEGWGQTRSSAPSKMGKEVKSVINFSWKATQFVKFRLHCIHALLYCVIYLTLYNPIFNPYSLPTADQMQTSPFNLIASYAWYCMENLASDLLLGLMFCLTTNSPNTVQTFCSEQVGRIKVKIFGAQRVNYNKPNI